MKIIDVPDKAVCPLRKGEQGPALEVTFSEFIAIALDQYGPFSSGGNNARQKRKLVAIVDGIGEAKSVKFEDADFNVVKAAVEGAKYMPRFADQLVPFYDAVDKAQDVKIQ